MRTVRYVARFDFRPRTSVVIARALGDEVKITEAEYEVAKEAGAVELINGESSEQGTASAEAGSPAPKGKGRNSTRD